MSPKTSPQQTRPRAGRQDGYTLAELVIVCALAVLALITVHPFLERWAAGVRVSLAAGEVSTALASARIYAIRNNENVALKFRTDDDGVVTMALYRDSDGDGVRNQDIDWGIDPEVRPPIPLQAFDRGVRFGFPSGEAPRKLGRPGRMTRLHDPIRFNNSDLASFTQIGTATPGTVYLTDGRRHLMAVRVTGKSGKVALWRYDRDERRWHHAG